MSGASSARILLGRIVDAHGIRGEVVVHSFADAPENVAAYGPLSNEACSRSFKLKVLRVTPKGVIARIDGIADRNAAEALKGTDLYVARDKLPKASDDEFYHADLIGLAAVAADGTAVGRVVNVQNFGAGDLIEIELTGSKRTEFLPFSDAFVPVVDIAAGRVVVVMPEGGDEPPPPEADKM